MINIRELIKKSVKEVLTEEFHHLHRDYRMYEGEQHITALFEDNSRLTFEVHFRNTHGADREKWRKKAFTKWKSLASEIHNDVQLNEVGNPMEKTWKQSFQEALKRPELQEFVRKPHHQKVFKKNDIAPCIDPVNFTKCG